LNSALCRTQHNSNPSADPSSSSSSSSNVVTSQNLPSSTTTNISLVGVSFSQTGQQQSSGETSKPLTIEEKKKLLWSKKSPVGFIQFWCVCVCNDFIVLSLCD
jgi:hypothetical protein